MTRYGIIEDYEYSSTHKRHRLTLWSGAFASVREGDAYSLPNGDGYMVNIEYGPKLRVKCPAPRNSSNWVEVDDAINKAVNRYRLEELRDVLRSESISYGELIELQGLAEYIDPGDVELLEAAGVPEHAE